MKDLQPPTANEILTKEEKDNLGHQNANVLSHLK